MLRASESNAVNLNVSWDSSQVQAEGTNLGGNYQKQGSKSNIID